LQFKASPGKKFTKSYLKKRAGGVAQIVVPEFKAQSAQKKKKKKKKEEE
jgi:hypothetical protein